MILPILGVIAVVAVVGFVVWSFVKPDNGVQGVTGKGNETQASEDDGLLLTEKTGPVLDAGVDHSATHGHYLANACDLAYYSQAEGAPKFREQLNLAARLISVDNTQAFVCENAGSIVLAFRGSELPTGVDGFKDWLLTNARNFLVLPEGRIGTDFAAAGVGARFHRGFMEALSEIWEPLVSAVEAALQRKERPIWITGHSLGGAVALLAAWRLHQKFISIHRIVTFGAPMIGNNAAALAFQREFGGRIIRYVDHSDMVPRLPTMSLLSNEYDHVQREIILGQESDSTVAGLMDAATHNSADGEIDESIANNLWGELHSGISSHLMGNYIARIAEQLTS